MTAMADTPPRHVVSATVAALRSRVESVGEASLWSMSSAETAATLVELGRLAAQVAELELRVAEHAHGLALGEGRGATSTGSWWAHETRATRAEAHRKMRLALVLDRYQRLRDGLAGGDVLVEQAHVHRGRPGGVAGGPGAGDAAESAEVALVHFAREHDARALRVLGRRILDVIDPAVGEAQEARRLEEEERAAAARLRFTMAEDGHGCVRGRFTLPVAVGAMLRKALLALAAPRHLAATEGRVPRRPGPERLGAAFAEYVERYPADRLPAAGGVAATVVVTMDAGDAAGR